VAVRPKNQVFQRGIDLNTVFVVGAGGHAKVVIDIIEKADVYEIAFLVDDDPSLKGKSICGYSILGGRNALSTHGLVSAGHRAVVAIGVNLLRVQMAKWLGDRGFQLISAVHPSAQLARGVTLGENTVVMAGAVINSDAQIGHSVIINTSAGVDHDCIIADGTHIAPGCHLCGSVTVGARTLVGAGTTIIGGVSIGCDTVIGAGSVVVADIPTGVVALGNPAKPIRSNL
jgi:sugar O-acyltransferase (sialic acid O-acetyltransferase NeuD family)